MNNIEKLDSLLIAFIDAIENIDCTQFDVTLGIAIQYTFTDEFTTKEEVLDSLIKTGVQNIDDSMTEGNFGMPIIYGRLHPSQLMVLADHDFIVSIKVHQFKDIARSE